MRNSLAYVFGLVIFGMVVTDWFLFPPPMTAVRHAKCPRTPFEELQAATRVCSRHSTTIGQNGAWCLRSHSPREYFAPNHELSKDHFAADPGVAAAVLDIVRNSTVLDLGAGLGQYGVWFGSEVKSYAAFDGALNVESFTGGYVCWTDLTEPFLGPQRDYVLSLEVGEHLPKSAQFVFVDSLTALARKCVFVSWAVPGQGGHGHANELPNEDVEKMFSERGFGRNETAERRVRAQSVFPWFRNTFMVYCRQ